MKTKLKRLAAFIVVASACTGLAFGEGPSGPSGKSNIAHLYIVEKDPTTFAPVPGGAWGKLVYTLSAPRFSFVFNGHKLDAGVAYTLIYYPDPWPGVGAICLAKGIADVYGNIHLKGTPDTGSLPIATDWNANPGTTTDPPFTGAKVWLVLTSDVTCSGNGMLAYHPTQYLFEMQLINYTKTY